MAKAKAASKKTVKKPAKKPTTKLSKLKKVVSKKKEKSSKNSSSKKSGNKKVKATGVTSKKVAKNVVKKTALEEKLERKTRAKKGSADSPAVHTKSRTGKEMLPSILTSAAFLEMTKVIDASEKKLGVKRTNLAVGGHIENAIATGVLMYDFVMGGGYAPGRFTVAPGAESSGKCVAGDTFIHTSRGIVRIDSLFHEGDAWDKLIPRRIRINTAEGPRMTSHIARRYARDLYEIHGRFSQTLKLTGEHKVYVADKKSGALTWVEAKKVHAGDTMFVKRSYAESVFGRYGDDDFDNTTIGKFNGTDIAVNTKLAYVLGVTYADGHIDKNNIRVQKKLNLAVLDKYSDNLRSLFGADSFSDRIYERASSKGVTYNYRRVELRTALTTWMHEIGVVACSGRDKAIPDIIMRGNRKVVKTFLRAYFSCDYSGEGIASEVMARQLAQLLLSIGIPSNMRIKYVKTQHGNLPYYTLLFGEFRADFDSLACFRDAVDKNGVTRKPNRTTHITGHKWLSYSFARDILDKFKAPMKFANNGSYLVDGEYKKLRLKYDRNITQAQLLADGGMLADSICEVLPTLGDTLDFIINNDLIAVEVLSVSRLPGKFPVYDVTVPDGHNFIANGFVVHNSSSIVTSLAQAVSQDVPVYVADAEASFEAGYADRALARFGYNMKQMQGEYDSKNNKWISLPMVRILQENNGEKVFRLFKRIMMAMPVIKRDYDGNYWAVTTDEKSKKESAIEYSGLPQMMFFIDSLAALIPSILDGDDEKETIGAQARMFSMMLPKIAALMTSRNCIVVGTNQLRDKIGGFSMPGAPKPTTQPGGQAVKFYTDIRTQINACASSTAGWFKSTKSYYEEPGIYGGVDRYVFTSFRNQKNKAFIPKREGYARIRFMKDGGPGDGYCETFDILSFLEATGQLTRRANTLSLDIQGTTRKKDAPTKLPIDPHSKKLNFMDFKRAVEDPKNRHSLWTHCRSQIKSGYAFSLERERVTNSKSVAAETEDE